jgi:hypothetical protein
VCGTEGTPGTGGVRRRHSQAGGRQRLGSRGVGRLKITSPMARLKRVGWPARDCGHSKNMITRRVRLRAHSHGGMVAGGRRGGAAEMCARRAYGYAWHARAAPGTMLLNRQVALGFGRRSVVDGTFIVCGWIPFRARPREGESDPIDCRHRVWAKEAMRRAEAQAAGGGRAAGGRRADGRVRQRADAWRH